MQVPKVLEEAILDPEEVFKHRNQSLGMARHLK